MAQDALNIMDHIGWTGEKSVHLVGLSMGGMITQELALLDTRRFVSMSLLSTIAGGAISLAYFLAAVPTGIKTLAKTFLSSSPQEQLKNGLQLLFPEQVGWWRGGRLAGRLAGRQAGRQAGGSAELHRPPTCTFRLLPSLQVFFY
jgi:pimeloyl-ACP methyl ester carboxylesterase